MRSAWHDHRGRGIVSLVKQAVAVPVIEAAIARIREDAAVRAEKQICLDAPLNALRDCLARLRANAGGGN